MVALLFCCFFSFLRSQLFLYTLQESTAVMHDECMISIHYMHDKCMDIITTASLSKQYAMTMFHQSVNG